MMVKFCPYCGSQDIRFSEHYTISEGGDLSDYECLDCTAEFYIDDYEHTGFKITRIDNARERNRYG